MEGKVLQKVLNMTITYDNNFYRLYDENNNILHQTTSFLFIRRASKVHRKGYTPKQNELMPFSKKDKELLDKDYLINSCSRECGRKYSITIFKGSPLHQYSLKSCNNYIYIEFTTKYETLLFIESLFDDKIESKAYDLLLDIDVAENKRRQIKCGQEIKFIREFKQSNNKYSISICDDEHSRRIGEFDLCKANVNSIKDCIIGYDLI